MTRKLSKEEIKDKLDGEELNLSLCNLTKVYQYERWFASVLTPTSINGYSCVVKPQRYFYFFNRKKKP